MTDPTGQPELKCPFAQCGECLYVGERQGDGAVCPACGKGRIAQIWPQVQWIGAAEDIAFLAEHKKLELLTIAVAAYFECLLHTFLYDGLYFLHEPTRVPGRCDRPDIEDAGNRFVAEQKEIRRREQVIEDLFHKHKGWHRRLNDLCATVFGTCFDGLLARHCGDVRSFVQNRDNIHWWRNQILHRGVTLEVFWPAGLRERIPAIALDFVRQCWDVFRVLYNECIHRPWWAEKQKQ